MAYINKPQRRPPQKRLTDRRKERQAIYNTPTWKSMRTGYLIDHPLCEDCLEQGKTTPSDDVHHKVSFMSVEDIALRKSLAYDYNNMRALCRACHCAKHA